jgi:CRISPR RNA silencing complex Cmr2 subunit-like protein
MPTYLDAGVVRIQPYLARTPELRLRRGASWLITKATSEAVVDAWIQGTGMRGVARNPEAGHADGVITVTVPDGQAPAIAARLVQYLREEIPAADLQASWAQAASYLEYRRARPQPGSTLLALPPAADFPLTRTCASCRVDPCAQPEMCADCVARDAAAGRRSTRPSPSRHATDDAEPDALGTERAVLAAVNQRTGLHLRPVRDMNDLARLGDRDGNRNHVATVALDGNGMGGFFAALTSQEDIGLKKRISPEISAATRSALAGAAASIVRQDDERLPVVPHVLGGDDVVVSVTAERAWLFTSAFQAGFSHALTEAATRLSLQDDVTRLLPTMSAGVIFAHASFPYARAVRLAEDALRQAKQDTGGARPAVAWLDVTVDGEQPPSWRRTLTQEALEGHRADLIALAGISRSGRQALARLLGAATEEEGRAAGLVWARRNGQAAVTGLLNQAPITELRNLLALTRWWRP